MKAVDLTSTPPHKSLHNLNSTHDTHHVTDLNPITHTKADNHDTRVYIDTYIHSYTHRSLLFSSLLLFTAAVRVRVHRGNTNPGASERGCGGEDSVDACFERPQCL